VREDTASIYGPAIKRSEFARETVLAAKNHRDTLFGLRKKNRYVVFEKSNKQLKTKKKKIFKWTIKIKQTVDERKINQK